MITDKFFTAAIAGHAEHGKTALLQCLAEIDSKVYKDENCGVYPETSMTPFRLPSGTRVASIVIPNHVVAERETAEVFNRVDLALLVVAADHGVTPQTEDHLEFFNRLRAQGGLTVLSKADLVDQETIQLARLEIREISKGSCLDGKPIIPFSKPDRRGLGHILTAIDEEANCVDGSSYFSTSHYKALKRHVLDAVTRILVQNVFKVAVCTDELLSRLVPPIDDLLLHRILRELTSEGKLVAIDRGFRIPTLTIRLPHNRAKYAEQMLDYARNMGCVTFNARTFCELHWKSFNFSEIRQLLEYLRKSKKLVQLSDGRYLTTDAIDEIRQKVTGLILRKGSLRVQDSWEILGYGRNRAIPVFDYLDSIGLTRRIEDFRVLNE